MVATMAMPTFGGNTNGQEQEWKNASTNAKRWDLPRYIQIYDYLSKTSAQVS
jgi:hypothetical protein